MQDRPRLLVLLRHICIFSFELPLHFTPGKDPTTLPIQMPSWGFWDSSRMITLLSKPQPLGMEAILCPCPLT